MAITRTLLASLMLTITGLVSTAQASEPEVVYIGLNSLKTNKPAQHTKAFHDYIDKLIPIMSAHNMGLEVYRVDHQSASETQVDFVTIGTAPSMQAMQTFFADEAFVAIFPELDAALADHTVVFVDQVLESSDEENGYLLLTMDWLRNKEGTEKVNRLNKSLVELGVEHAAKQLGRSRGVLANEGLGAGLRTVEAPDFVTFWHMLDPHAFLEHGVVEVKNRDMAGLMKKSREFWLTRQHY